MISYAQDFEDVLLNRIFQSRPTGFYIDVGACDPVALSVTKFFYDLGWHGINIEPVPEAWERFTKARPRDINLNVAAGARSGRRAFHQAAHFAFSSFDAGIASAAPMGRPLKTYDVEVRTLAEICAEYQVGEIDFLKIDVEGAEQEVLEGSDFTRWRPRVLMVEDGPRPLPSQSGANASQTWEPRLLKAGYLPACANGPNRFYLRREDEEFLPRLAHLTEFQRDVHLAEDLPPAFDAIAPGYRVQVRELRNSLNALQAAMAKPEVQTGASTELKQNASGFDRDLTEAQKKLSEVQVELQESWSVRSEQRRMYQALAHELRRQQQHLSVLRAVHREMLYRNLRRPPLWKRLLGLAPSRAQALAALKVLEAEQFAIIPEMKAEPPPPQAEPPPPQAEPPPPQAERTPVAQPKSTVRRVNACLEVVESEPASADALHGAWRVLVDTIASVPENGRPSAVRVHPLLDLEFAESAASSALHPDTPWLGILHAPRRLPTWQAPLFPKIVDWNENAVWRSYGSSCKGLIALTEDLGQVLKGVLPVPTHALCHPLRTGLATWSMQRFRANPKPALVQVGTRNRCVHAIFMLPRSAYAKVLLHTLGEREFSAHLKVERNPLGRQLLPGMLETAEVRSMPTPQAYEDLITSNLLFLHLCDASADAVLLECIERQIPLLVNRAPAVWEYLGPEYPLYYSFYGEAAEKSADLGLIEAAHQYLGKLRTQERFQAATFRKNLAAILAAIPR